MADKLIFVVTCADEKPDKATIPFALGNSALAMDTEAIIILQSTGVFLGKKDYARHIHATGFPTLSSSWKYSRKKAARFTPVNPVSGRAISVQKTCLTASR